MDISDAMPVAANDRLKALAFEREDAATYRDWLRLDADARREALLDRHVLLSVFTHAAHLMSQFEPRGHIRAQRWVARFQSLIDELATVWAGSRHEFSQEWFQALDRWSAAALGNLHFDVAAAALRLASATGARRYPGLWQALRASEAELLARTGRIGEAGEIAAWYARRPYLLPERRRLPQIYLRLLSALLLSGRVADYRCLLWRGLAEAFLDTPLRDEFTARIRRTYRGHARALFLSGASISDRCQLALHLAHQLVRLLPPMRWLRVDRAAFWVPAAVGYWLSQRRQRRHAGVTPDAGQPLNAVLVTRAMGGIGDLLTMTPGLRALRRKHPGTEIHFAIPRQFFPVFEGNDDFTCIDIESATLDPNRYRAWFDLTDCPASRVESRQAPNVRIGRIELFARAMGLSAAAVRGEGARPRYLISIAEQLVAEQTAVAMQLRGRPLVGLQWAAAETYRNYPHNSELVRLLARRCNVLILGAPVPSECAIDGVHSVMAPLRQGFALASLCDVLIGPDSSFLHLAGALAKPMLMLAGPVDGQLRARDYPTVEALMPDRREFPCAPCWRNEAINCYLSGRRESVCLRSIAPAAVAERVFALLPRSLLKDVGEDDQKIQPSAIGTAAPAT